MFYVQFFKKDFNDLDLIQIIEVRGHLITTRTPDYLHVYILKLTVTAN
jgi:hypothetical protein